MSSGPINTKAVTMRWVVFENTCFCDDKDACVCSLLKFNGSLGTDSNLLSSSSWSLHFVLVFVAWMKSFVVFLYVCVRACDTLLYLFCLPALFAANVNVSRPAHRMVSSCTRAYHQPHCSVAYSFALIRTRSTHLNHHSICKRYVSNAYLARI